MQLTLGLYNILMASIGTLTTLIALSWLLLHRHGLSGPLLAVLRTLKQSTTGGCGGYSLKHVHVMEKITQHSFKRIWFYWKRKKYESPFLSLDYYLSVIWPFVSTTALILVRERRHATEDLSSFLAFGTGELSSFLARLLVITSDKNCVLRLAYDLKRGSPFTVLLIAGLAIKTHPKKLT
jgi:hypothetical protein